MITITGTLLSNNASHFGFGIKNSTGFNSIIYRGSNGAVEELNYQNTTLKTPTWRTSGTTYAVGDVVSVRIYFDGNNLFWKTAKNGVWQQETTPTKTFQRTGELVIVIRNASSWGNVYTNIETVNNYAPLIYINPNGKDSNLGTEELPIKTVTKAKDLTKRNGVIVPQSGIYYDDLTFDLRRSLTMIADSLSNVRFVYGKRFSEGTLIAGSTRVRKVSHPNIIGTTSAMCLWIDQVADTSTLILPNEVHPLQRGKTYRNDNLKVTYKSSIALLESSDPTQAYWYQTGNEIYYTYPLGVSQSEHNLVVSSKGNNTVNNFTIGYGVSGTNVIIKNITFNYAPLDLSRTTFEVVNVHGGCVTSEAVFKMGYNFNSILSNCSAYGAYFSTSGFGDGFSITANTYIPNQYNTSVTFQNLWAFGSEDDGLTNHGGTLSTVYGGLFEYNGSGITPGSGGDANIHNVLVRNNSLAGINCVGSPLDGSPFTEANVFDSTCINNGNNFYLYNQPGLKMTAENCSSMQGTGTHYSANVVRINCTQN
jgi:hypothetical protein